MRLFVCMLDPFMQKNVTLYCPLWWQPLLCSLLILFFTITSSYNAQFSLTLNDLTLVGAIFIALFAPMTTYLKDLTQSIGRYGGLSWQNWVWGYSEAQVVSLLGAKNLASMRGKGKLNMLDYPWQYNFYSDIGKHNPLCCLTCPTSTF